MAAGPASAQAGPRWRLYNYLKGRWRLHDYLKGKLGRMAVRTAR
ncbi:hypothetical protein ACIRL2_27705 [Embleya sp. NPDC127516]